jgi:hypothetical protein
MAKAPTTIWFTSEDVWPALSQSDSGSAIHRRRRFRRNPFVALGTPLCPYGIAYRRQDSRIRRSPEHRRDLGVRPPLLF